MIGVVRQQQAGSAVDVDDGPPRWLNECASLRHSAASACCCSFHRANKKSLVHRWGVGSGDGELELHAVGGGRRAIQRCRRVLAPAAIGLSAPVADGAREGNKSSGDISTN
uniref:Uncharacterized protein n=1 Tax=Plectus sambesii TaxID=2011161 RepID=A0A914UN66_9BILA